MDSAAAVALSLCGGLSAPQRRLLLDTAPSVAEVLRLTADDCAEILGRRLPADWATPAAREATLQRILRYLERGRVDLLVYGQREYPAELTELYAPPFLLYLRGSLPAGDERVAVVGTRSPDEEARAASYALAAELSLAGAGVISGLAYGIDGAAHWGAVHYGGRTVAVLAHGVDAVYPGGHKELAASILRSGGGLLSEYPPGTVPRRYHFPERNRLISGLCRGTVIVQAPEKSGALITADYALEQGRDVWVHRAGLSGSRSAGTVQLHREGAPAAEHAEDILAEWGYRAGAGKLRELNSGELPAADMIEEELAGRVTRFAGHLFRRAG